MSRSLARILSVAMLVMAVSALRAFGSPAGYVYVLMTTPGAAPTVQVFDGATAQLVTGIPLPADSVTPAGLAISPDGSRIYVSTKAGSGTATRLTVVDARHHVLLTSFVLAEQDAGTLAVSPDGSKVFMLRTASSTTMSLLSISTANGAILGSTTFDALGAVMIVDAARNRLDVARHPLNSGLTGNILHVDAYDMSLTLLQSSGALGGGAADAPIGIALSPDGSRLHVTTTPMVVFGSNVRALRDYILNPVSLAFVSRRDIPVSGDPEVLRSNGDLITLGGSLELPDPPPYYIGRTPLSGPSSTIPVESDSQAFKLSPLQTLGFYVTTATTVNARDIETGALVMSRTFGPSQTFNQGVLFRESVATPFNTPSCTYRLDSSYASFNAAQTVDVPIRLTTDCAWSASADQSWIHVDRASGTGNATFTLSADVNTSGQTRRATVLIGGQIVTVTQGSPQDARPAFGVIDTPSDGVSGVSGSIAITGWALDELAVQSVLIYRDPVPAEPQTLIPIGTATLVEGARPDVQAAFPTLPFASRAGWGYMLLTNVLPQSPDGSYRIHVFVADLDGHSTFLGTRTIHVNHTTATLPFGAIDTPGQGEAVSGVITNWGWALTPQPANIPTNGSTIDVLIDGVVVGHPTYGLDRADIAALFPGYANTNSAVGYFTIDTTTLTNGVHTIAWVVRDNMGRAQGIGSRYFTVVNP
jgi:hypothetical protein